MSGIALKITSLLVRTIAKPIGNAIKAQAREHERFRKLCIKFAQSMHSTEIKLRMSLLGENKIRVKPLNDNKAIEQGATFISEFFIFSVAGSLILYESYRSRKKASNERDALADDIAVLQSEIEYIKTKLGDINIKLDDYQVPEGYKPKYIKLENNNNNNNNNDSSKSESSSQPPNEEEAKS
ncbi:OPA3-like protein [Candida viswanathii]|uniref:OPA3-like protein n=1 Tax=Candida viswanathii TaxID=5486 RepID=A0A367Y1D8_9ASCO|nr:OPA3-like protein [Candida viswanathii]